MLSCPLVINVLAFLETFPTCLNYGRPNMITVSSSFPLVNSSLTVKCHIPIRTSGEDIDLYQITSRNSMQNITTKKTTKTITAEISGINGMDVKSFCCCKRGNCTVNNDNLGSAVVLIGVKPSKLLSFYCEIHDRNTLTCTWDARDKCIHWMVRYTSRTQSGTCPMAASCNHYCPHSKCFVKSNYNQRTLCPRCEIKLFENISKDEEITFTLLGQNLWGERVYQERIVINESLVKLNPVTNLAAVISEIDSILIQFDRPSLLPAFDTGSNLTCKCEAITRSEKSFCEEMMLTTNDEEKHVKVLINNLLPQSLYTINVKCKLTGSERWSNSSMLHTSTKSARPLRGPLLDPDAYSVRGSRIFVYFSEMDRRIARGTILGYKVILPYNQTCQDCNISSVCISVPFKDNIKDVHLQIYSINEKGVSINCSHLLVVRSVKTPVVVVVFEKDENMVELTPYSKNGILGVSKMYKCLGKRKFGTVVCESEFQEHHLNDTFSVFRTSDLNWFYGVTLTTMNGIFWQTLGCLFDCPSCKPSKPSMPFVSRELLSSNILLLHIKELFCAQNQWVPYRYQVTYHPVGMAIKARNMSVLATPFLQTISLRYVNINTKYTISLSVESKSMLISNVTTVEVYTNIESSPSYNSKVLVIVIAAVICISLSVIFVFRICKTYRNYRPEIDLPNILTQTRKER